jgi:hypothetical protein
VNVGDLDGYVVQPGAAFRQKLAHRSFIAERLEEFHVGISHGQHADLDALLFNFVGGNVLPGQAFVAPNRQTLFDARRGDSDVINF